MRTYLRRCNFNVPGYGLKVNGDLEIRTDELSGETSGSDTVNKGVKPKTLTVSLNIRFIDEADLRDLVRVAQAGKSNGDLVVYTIVNRTANAAGIRQVSFTDHFRWTEQEGPRAWSVSFTLREYLSVPERVEQRGKAANTVGQTSKAAPVAADGETAASATATPMTNFEKLLARVEEMLE